MWDVAWDNPETGQIIKRTNGFRAFMKRAEFEKTPLRNYFVTEQDGQISDIIWDYFDAVRAR